MRIHNDNSVATFASEAERQAPDNLPHPARAGQIMCKSAAILNR